MTDETINKIPGDIFILLPDEILNIIFEYMDPIYKYNLNRENFHKYHYILKDYVAPRYDSYIRDIIRTDSVYVFGEIVNESFSRWLKIKSIPYEAYIFSNYIELIRYLIKTNNANNCDKLLIDKLKQANLYKNWHKKNRIKNIRWTN